jgi:hypothetical protein
MAGEKEDTKVMPAGAMPPEPEVEEEVEEQPEPILGKFKNPDELATAYTELEKKLGEQGSELGNLKQMNSMMLKQMETRQAQDQTPATEAEKDSFDYDSGMAEIAKGVQEGDLSIEEALAQTANLTAEKATRNALSQYEQMTAKQQQEAAQQKFLEEHPDFVELQQTGKLDQVKKTLPGMHDDFSAYFAFQADQALADAQAKQELEKIAQGDERTDKVLSKPGAKAKDIGKPKGKLSQAELKKHTLARLEAME